MWGACACIYVLAVLAVIEMFSRVLGSYDYYIPGEKHVVWDMAWTTKQVETSGCRSVRRGSGTRRRKWPGGLGTAQLRGGPVAGYNSAREIKRRSEPNAEGGSIVKLT